MKKVTLLISFIATGLSSFQQTPRLVKDITPGSGSSDIRQIKKAGNNTFFTVNKSGIGELFRTDGTEAGTYKLNLTYPGYSSADPEELIPLGNKVIFAADLRAPYNGLEVWSSDGTQAGTIPLENFSEPGNGSTTLGKFYMGGAMGNYVYYFAIPAGLSHHMQLRRTNGTFTGTELVAEIPGYVGASKSIVLNGQLFFVMANYYTGINEIWVSDGTAAGTNIFKSFPASTSIVSVIYAGNQSSLVNAGNLFYFLTSSPDDGLVLWRSNGFVNQTFPVKSFVNNNSTFPAAFHGINIGSIFYFIGEDGVHGLELWRSDGTPNGTYLAADIQPGPIASFPTKMIAYNNNLYFDAFTESYGRELWKFDGVNASIVKDIVPGSGSGSPSYLAESNGLLLYSVNTQFFGGSIYFTNGVNTQLLSGFGSGSGIGVGPFLTPGNPVYFLANNGTSGQELFVFDNSPAITHKIYVNDNNLSGDLYSFAVGDNSNTGTQYAPVATINHAISIAQPGDTILVDAGTYIENVVVNKSVVLKGAKAGINPSTSLNRGAETIVLTATNDITNATVFSANATDITIDGFLIDGDNPALGGGVSLNGIDVNAGYGVFNQQQLVNGLQLKNNIIKNFNRYGIFLQRNGQPTVTEDNAVTYNHFDNIGNRGVGMFANAYATVSNNNLTRVVNGIVFANATIATTLPIVVANNIVEANTNNIHFQTTLAPSVSVTGNTLSTNGATNNGKGILVVAVTATGSIQLLNNTVSNKTNGIDVSTIAAPSGMIISGSVTNSSSVGVFVTDDDVHFSLDNLNLTNNAVGIDASSLGTMPISFSNTSIVGGTTGIRFYGPGLSLPGNALTGVSFSNQTKEYILQTVNSFNGQVIDASTAVFDGLAPINMTQAQLFATEDKLTHKMDFNDVGYFKLKPNKIFITPNSFAATLPPVFGVPTTFPDINRAVGCANAGDTIYIAAGTYANQVTIDKGITMIGEGQNTTLIVPPSSPYVAPPGPFTETGLIQTAQDIADVHIRNLSVTGDHLNGLQGIIIQSGGSVKNCKVQNGSQGIFMRVESATKTAILENNIISAEYIAVNIQGSGLTGSLINNTITALNPGFSAGVFFGLDFGPIPQITATGNTISGYAHSGFFGGSLNASITQNSMSGSGPAFWKLSGNTMQASCNWLGTSDAEAIAAKINGDINYFPWLTNGADNDGTLAGFQPVTGSCNGRQNKFYVNDNSQTGDVLTTAIGNNSNNGFSSAPFATFEHAYNITQAGDTIYMDAGTYDLGGLIYQLAKPITLRGTNYLVSPNDPANKLQLNGNRNEESIMTNGKFFVIGKNISLEGFTISMGNSIEVEFEPDADRNFKFSKNILKITNTTNGINQLTITGTPVISPNKPINSGYTISDNRFEKSGSAFGNTLTFNYVKNVSVTDNSFVVTGNYFKTQQAVNLGITGTVDSFSFSNNIVSQASTAIGGNRIATAVISGNKIFNTVNAFINNNSMPESSNIEVSNNELSNDLGTAFMLYYRSGVSTAGTSNLLKVENNIISGITAANVNRFATMNFTVLNTVLNPSLIINGNKIDYSGDFSSVGSQFVTPITLRGNIASVNLTNNELVLNNTGGLGAVNPSGFSPANPAFTINTDFSSAGYMPSNAVINILNNKIQGFKQSVVFYDGSSSSGHDTYTGYGNIPAGATININNNSFEGDSISINNGTNSQVVNANCNWYDTAATQTVKTKVTASTVNYSPWLSNGTDADTTTGFQPVGGSCNGRQNKFYVNDSAPWGDVLTTAIGNNSNNGFSSAPFATIDYAYGIAQAGDTIYVDAGYHNLNGSIFQLNKPITLRGTNYLVSPNDATDKLQLNAARNAESMIMNGKFFLVSKNISLEGFTLYNDYPIVGNTIAVESAADTSHGNFKFSKNILIMTNTTGLNQFAITGKSVTSPNRPINSGYTISDNRFEKLQGAPGNTFNFNYVKNVSITDNSFVVTGNTFKTQQAVNLGATGIVDSFSFCNNTVSEASIAIGGNRIATAVFSGNKIFNTTHAFSNGNSMPESSNIEFSNNELSNYLGTALISYGRSGISNAGTSNLLKVENNVISGISAANMNQSFGGMNFTVWNTVLNPSLIINGNKINYSGDFSSVGSQFLRPITVRGNIPSVSLENNEVVLNNTGGLGAVNPATPLAANPAFTINTDVASTAYMPSNAVINILNNKVQGFKQSVVFYDGSPSGRDTYSGYGNIPAGATVNINNNSFTGDSISINNGTSSQIVNASCNWYDTAAAQAVKAKVTASTVNYSPWLSDGTDADANTGFQPSGACNGTPVLVMLDNTTDVTCHGINNGIINITISGGVTPYTIAWLKDEIAFSSNEDLSSLAPGIYHLTVTDANGSNAELELGISEPEQLTASATGTNVSCNGGANGSASVTAEGGTVPYSYLWSNGETTDAITNLVAGNYTVTITDANGCTTNANYVVTQPAVLTAIATGTSTSCFNSITVVAQGGTSPYTYLWSNGSSATTISNITAGTYSVTVTDAHGCTIVASATVTANEAFNPTASVTNVSCYGGTDGSITVTNVNAVAPFQYSIDGGLNFQSSNVFNGLAAGTYTITVKDANGCTGFVTKIITQPTQLIATVNNIQSSCFAANTGAINVSVTGGSPAYSYSWTGTNNYSSAQLNISNLAAGSYLLTITDSRGCTATKNVVVPSFNEMIINSTATNVLCKGENNGAINLAVSGGTGNGFTYLWNTGAVTSSISNLTVGNYSVVITDAGSGCTVSRSFTITQPAAAISLSATKTNATGCNSLGTISATGSGGTGPYHYKLRNGNYQSSGLFTGLYAGVDTVWVKDANGCTKSTVVTITDNGSDEYESNNSKTQARAINVGANIFARLALATDIDWFKFTTPAGNNNYTVTVTRPVGNVSLALYSSANNSAALVPISSTASSKTYALSGNSTYYVNVSGSLSYVCYQLTVTTSQAGISAARIGTSYEAEAAPQELTASVFPNPHQGNFTMKLESPVSGKATIELFNVSGQKLAEKLITLQKGSNNLIPFNGIRQGVIFYRVRINNFVVNGKILGTD